MVACNAFFPTLSVMSVEPEDRALCEFSVSMNNRRDKRFGLVLDAELRFSVFFRFSMRQFFILMCVFSNSVYLDMNETEVSFASRQGRGFDYPL